MNTNGTGFAGGKQNENLYPRPKKFLSGGNGAEIVGQLRFTAMQTGRGGSESARGYTKLFGDVSNTLMALYWAENLLSALASDTLNPTRGGCWRTNRGGCPAEPARLRGVIPAAKPLSAVLNSRRQSKGFVRALHYLPSPNRRTAFSLRMRGRTSSFSFSCSKSFIQRSGVRSG